MSKPRSEGFSILDGTDATDLANRERLAGPGALDPSPSGLPKAFASQATATIGTPL